MTSALIRAYETGFERYNKLTAQVLLTHEDLANRQRYLNARATLSTLFKHGVLAIVNENDTVTTDEIRLGDNDTLGAQVANLIDADVLVLLTDHPFWSSRDLVAQRSAAAACAPKFLLPNVLHRPVRLQSSPMAESLGS